MSGEHVEGLTIKQAAAQLGISPDSVRRRIKSGALEAFRVPTAQGYEWRIALTHRPPSASRQVGGTPTQDAAQLGSAPMQDRQANTQPLVEMVERLHRENMQLAGRVGFLEGKLQDAEQKILALSAPVNPEPTVIDQAREDTGSPSLWRRLLGLSPAV